MDCKMIACLGAWVLALGGCPSADDATGATDGNTDGATTQEHACHPGTTLDCACSNGAMGVQTCAADGQSYGMCECADAESSTSASTTTTSAPTTEGTADTTDGTSTTGSAASSTGEGTTAAGCEPGEAVECDCVSGPGVATCTDGELGLCECCMGSHPLVEGELRYCEKGHCYCGDLQMAPPLDACYAEAIADPCCPVELECY